MYIDDLKEKFIKVVSASERTKFADFAYDAICPTITIFCDCDKFISHVKHVMDIIWPSYKHSFLYYNCNYLDNIKSFSNFNRINESQIKTLTNADTDDGSLSDSVDTDAIKRDLNGALSDRERYVDFNQIFVNFIYDLKPDCNVDIGVFFNAIKEFEKNFSGLRVRTNIFLTIDETIENFDKAQVIKNSIAKLYDTNWLNEFNSVFVVGNRTQGGINLDDMYISRIIGDCITYFVDKDSIEDGNMSGGVCAVGFSSQDKPLENISNVISVAVLKGIDKIIDDVSYGNINIKSSNNKKLDGIVELLDEFIETLPKGITLEKFPRSTSDPNCDMSALSFDQLDDVSLGAWRCYVSASVRDYFMCQDNEDNSSYSILCNILRTFLNVNILAINNEVPHKEQLRQEFKDCISGTINGTQRSEIYSFIIDNLVNCRFFDSIICKVIEDSQKQSLSFHEKWNKIKLELSETGYDENRDIDRFYVSVVKAYFDKNSETVASKLIKATDFDHVMQIVEDVFLDIIESNNYIAGSFEDELIHRYNLEDKDVDYSKIIKENLFHDLDICYKPTSDVIHMPTRKIAMCPRNSSVKEYICNTVGRESTVVDTSNNDSVDVLYFYCLKKSHFENSTE